MTGHLIHIGFAKTGSNFLRRWFEAHPQLDFVEGGIAGFRNVYDISRRSAAPRRGILYRVSSSEGLATPHPFIGDPVVDHDRLFCADILVAQAEACALLASLFPTAHILLVTRGFRAMILSAYSQVIRNGGAFDFSFMRDGIRNEVREGRYPWDYDRLANLYGEAFGDRLIVMPYELLRDDADAFVRTLEERLGLGHLAPSAKRENPALSPTELVWYPRLSRFVRRLPVGGRLRTRLLRLYVPLTMKGRLRPVASLLQRLRPSTPVTADLITDDLVDSLRGKAEQLKNNPLYAPYADDYLL